MAHNGGRSSPPRVHRSRAPVMSAPPPPPPLTAPLAPLRLQSPPPPVTLAAPRPENERAANEYVETPFRPARPPPPAPPPRAPVTKQPAKAAAAAAATPPPPPADCAAARPSIVCPECSRCRCESCRRPRPLPQRWLCDDGCLLSADAVVDYASCLCCVKGLFYHCSEAEGESCADEPCGCGPDRRRTRWACLGALSFLLPCLWLYWPLRGCKHAVEACYARHSRTGCRCRPHQSATPEKRLLDSSPDF